MNKYWKLFSSTLYLSSFTFGGGYVMIPLMKNKFVNDLKWIEDDEMTDLIAIAQSSPGSLAVNASILVGYKIAGLRGALITTLGTMLPPLFILSIISIFYVQFRDNIYVSAALNAMQAGVAAVILDVVYTMAYQIFTDKNKISIFVMFIAFIAGALLDVNVLLIILAAGSFGAWVHLRGSKDETIS